MNTNYFFKIYFIDTRCKSSIKNVRIVGCFIQGVYCGLPHSPLITLAALIATLATSVKDTLTTTITP